MDERHRADTARGVVRLPLTPLEGSLDWRAAQPGRVFLGQHMVTAERARTKYVDPRSRYYPFSPGELARLYLDRLRREQTPGQRRIYHVGLPGPVERSLWDVKPPLWFQPKRGREGYFAYVDIRSCYFQLFHALALNLLHNPATGWRTDPAPRLLVPATDWAWLHAEKPVRHAIFGMMQTSRLSWYESGTPRVVEGIGRYSSPGLVGFVLGRVREVAKAAIREFDVRMWLTDAAILPDKDRNRFRLWLEERWGLEASVKARGMGHLYAHGDYIVGDLESDHDPHRTDRFFSNLGSL